MKELRLVLTNLFSLTQKDCYQELQVLPALDELKVTSEKVTLVIYEPHPGGLHPDLKKFYENLDFKNRILFLSGEKDNLENLLEVSREHKAINDIMQEMDEEQISPNDPQRVMALDKQDKIMLQVLSAARETFITLTYPHKDRLVNADFRMEYTNNQYHGEQQIRETLKSKQKFTDDVASDTFRKKCEARIFTQKVMLWSEVKKRASTNTSWQWHHPNALDELKEDMIYKDQWRDQGSGYVEKGPFAPPVTEVLMQELNRDDDTGEVTLRLTPVHGDTIHYEINTSATTASMPVKDARAFKTSDLMVSFLCADSTGQHETGVSKTWNNRITLKSRVFQGANGEKMVELQSAPSAPIRYTTDGSDPKVSGGSYNEPFEVQESTWLVLAVAEKNGVISDVHRLEIKWGGDDGGVDDGIDPVKPAIWRREHTPTTTKETFDFLSLVKKHDASMSITRLAVIGDERFADLNLDGQMQLGAEKIEEVIKHLRGLLSEGEVNLEASSVSFPAGQNLLDWVADVKTKIEPGEVEQ